MTAKEVAAVTALQLAQQLRTPEPPQLLDCRESHEWEYCRIDGARHIPMQQVPARIGEIDASRPLVVYCHHGLRSQVIAEFLARKGLPKVANLAGGIDAWSCQVDHRVPRY